MIWLWISIFFSIQFFKVTWNDKDCYILHISIVSHISIQLLVLFSIIYAPDICFCFPMGRGSTFCFSAVVFRSFFSDSWRKSFMASLNTNRGSGSESGGQLQVSLISRAYREGIQQNTKRTQSKYTHTFINIIPIILRILYAK